MNTPTLQTTIQNRSSYSVLIALSMIYMSVMLCNAVVTNRYIGYDQFYLLGGAFVSPFIFILDDIIAEIYGYKVARSVILLGFAGQTFFALIAELIVLAPSPSFFQEKAAYSYILGPSLLRIDVSGFVAYIIANLLNSYILTRWKVLLKGRKFWLRSLGSSTFSEALYSFIAILMIGLHAIPMKNIINIIIASYIIKSVFSIIFSFPSQLLVNYLKKITGIDVYDFSPHLTPLKYLRIFSTQKEVDA